MAGFVSDARAADEQSRTSVAWLDALEPAQRRAGRLPFDSTRRLDWHFVPRSRPGVAIGQMSATARDRLRQMLESVLSVHGIEMVDGVFKCESVLADLSGNRTFRDPGNYAMVVFGSPGDRAPWGWRFEGHHLSLNVTVAPGVGIAVTPAFFGANPGRVPDGHRHAGFRLLGAQEDEAFSLVQSLEVTVRDAAMIADRSLGEIVSGPGRETLLRDAAEGVVLSRLSDGQRDGVGRIMDLYVSAMRAEIAVPIATRIREAGADTLRFAWAGSLEPGRPHYFRIHGPRILIEYDNTQNGANHVHSVWIDPEDPLGSDTLARHHRHDHGG